MGGFVWWLLSICLRRMLVFSVRESLLDTKKAMGQNPNRTPSEHPNPTTKIGYKMGGDLKVRPLQHGGWGMTPSLRPHPKAPQKPT